MKHKVKKALKRIPVRRRKPEDSLQEAIHNIPRITNETVAEHREEVLSSARKYIYPLQHSLRRVVTISTSIFAVLLIGFFVYCFLALYRFDSTSTFIYRVTQVLPFPVARSCGQYISYENYLFELRHYIHYYQTQQQVDFNSASGKQQLAAFRKTTLQAVIDDACVKKLASQNHISVTSQELNDEITLLRDQNRLGSSDAVFENVLKEFWGWSLDDFKRELKMQLLTQKVVAVLDTQTNQLAQNVLKQLNNGGNFATLAQQYSQDSSTKANGGDYGIAIDETNRDLAPQVVAELFKLQTGQTSGIIQTPTGLEIVKLEERDGTSVRAAHIYFAFKPISTYVAPLETKQKPSIYIAQ